MKMRIPWNKGLKLGKNPEHSKRMKGRKITEEHKKNISKALKGKIPKNLSLINANKSGSGNPAWKGGITSENYRQRRSIEARLWREAVFARDNWTCQVTGIKGGKLVAHHLDNFADYPDKRFAIDNGITLSIECHSEFHKIYGYRKTTKEKFKEFEITR